jgi:hypothetical protein
MADAVADKPQAATKTIATDEWIRAAVEIPQYKLLIKDSGEWVPDGQLCTVCAADLATLVQQLEVKLTLVGVSFEVFDEDFGLWCSPASIEEVRHVSTIRVRADRKACAKCAVAGATVRHTCPQCGVRAASARVRQPAAVPAQGLVSAPLHQEWLRAAVAANSTPTASSRTTTPGGASLLGGSSIEYVRLDVGGTAYTTMLSTLAKVSGSMLATMFQNVVQKGPGHASVPLAQDETGAYILDRDGPSFRYVLAYLRGLDNARFPAALPADRADRELLAAEADYYMLPDLVGMCGVGLDANGHPPLHVMSHDEFLQLMGARSIPTPLVLPYTNLRAVRLARQVRPRG